MKKSCKFSGNDSNVVNLDPGSIPPLQKGYQMGVKSDAGEIELLLDLLDQGYDKKAWHGPNLRGAIRRVSAQEAAWKSDRARHTIAELVMHCAYWKYAVRRRLLGAKRGSFPIKGSNWFQLPQWLSDSEWRSYVALLDEQHQELREAVSDFPAAQLHARSKGSKFSAVGLITGIAAHDIYHAGQIQVLKRLQARRANS
jgi:hypothetical protein